MNVTGSQNNLKLIPNPETPNKELQLIRSGNEVKQSNLALIKETGVSSGRNLELIRDETSQLQKIPVNKDNVNINFEKSFSEAGVEANISELKDALKEYGVNITKDNLALLAEYSKNLPKGLNNNSQLLAFMLSRRIPTDKASIALDYLNGNLKFDKLFSNLPKEALLGIKQSWGEGQMLEALRRILSGSGSEQEIAKAFKTENFASNLIFQELATTLPTFYEEGQIFFQWPVFWNNSDIPDTLEGEAYVPDKDKSEQGFGLRLVVTPPSLGQIEVKMNSFKRNLNAAFGVEEKAFAPINSIFESTKNQILKLGDFDSVRFSLKVRQPSKNFFVKELPKQVDATTAYQRKFTLDLKA